MENTNFVTGALYSSANQELLEEHKEGYGLISNQWAGYRQFQQAGRQVIQGAKACKIMMVCEKKTEAKGDNGEDKKRKVVKALYVFNIDQTEAI